MTSAVKDYCEKVYLETYLAEFERLKQDFSTKRQTSKRSDAQFTAIEHAAQKEAIKKATIEGLKKFNDVEAALVWRAIYETHVHRKSGINDAETIAKVISADQSWKVTSGHAFEEIILSLGSVALNGTNLEMVMPLELAARIKAEQLANEPRDISWLNEQIRGKVFDLYIIVHNNDRQYCFGCIQSKTSIRDRVTRDREPSIKAMQSFFWSIAIALDGDFLKYPEFSSMVNGGTAKHKGNGWHGMYVFSELYTQGRIYPTNSEFKNFKHHAIKAADYWLTQRQWLNADWIVN